jgi:hypothetical protein
MIDPVEKARVFVNEAVLPAAPGRGLEGTSAVDSALDTGKNQASVVGSDVISFVNGVTAEQRQDLINSVLLAQLVAKVQIPDATKIYDWYNAYFNVLKQVGWLVQDEGFETYHAASEGFEAHEAIIGLATVLLAPNPTALAVVKAALDSLKRMDASSPWLTIFDRESQTAQTARFQVSVASPTKDSQFLVTLMAFGLEARSTLTQVLFFKFHANDALLKHYSGKITIDAQVLAGVRDMIRDKLAAHVSTYVKNLPDLDVNPSTVGPPLQLHEPEPGRQSP